jgi:hypothetical protein
VPYKDPEKRRAANRRWAKSPKGRKFFKKYSAQWRLMNKDRVSRMNRRALLKHHGLTEADYAYMVKERDSCCDLCREAVKKLFIDHDHKTLKIRGLLCSACNLALGHLKDRPEVAARIPTYLGV